MKSYTLIADENNLRETFLIDAIGRTADVCSFAGLLQNIEGACSISIDGRWGTGKTFFIKQCKLVLDSINPNVPFSKTDNASKVKDVYVKVNEKINNDTPIVTAYYDAWLHDGEEDPIISVLYEMMKGNYDSFSDSKHREWGDILATLAEVISNRSITDLARVLKGTDFFELQRKNEEVYRKINSIIDSFLPERGNKLVLFVDELDRCSPAYAVKLLERIKHYFINENVVFVFAINTLELQKTIKRFYGDDFDACRYLDRFFDMRLEIPPFDMNKYLNLIYIPGRRNLRERTCFEIISQKNMSMREMSRYLQLSRMAAYKFTDGDLRERQKYESLDEGLSKMIGFDIVLPIAIGLKLTNSLEYDAFMSGENTEWLEKVMLSPDNDWILNLLLNKNESYINKLDKILVKREEKVKDVYNAILSDKTSGSKYQIAIGEAIFERGLKESIIKAMGLVSRFSDINA